MFDSYDVYAQKLKANTATQGMSWNGLALKGWGSNMPLMVNPQYHWGYSEQSKRDIEATKKEFAKRMRSIQDPSGDGFNEDEFFTLEGPLSPEEVGEQLDKMVAMLKMRPLEA